MLSNFFTSVKTAFDRGLLFRRLLIVAIMVLTFRLSVWATGFADKALSDKADLLGAAAIITAVAGVPVAIITALMNKYSEIRQNANVGNGS